MPRPDKRILPALSLDGVWNLRAGMHVYALQRIIGPSDLSILRRNLTWVEQDLEAAYRKHGAVDNMLEPTRLESATAVQARYP